MPLYRSRDALCQNKILFLKLLVGLFVSYNVIIIIEDVICVLKNYQIGSSFRWTKYCTSHAENPKKDNFLNIFKLVCNFQLFHFLIAIIRLMLSVLKYYGTEWCIVYCTLRLPGITISGLISLSVKKASTVLLSSIIFY
jgi:hypothetical protein